VLAFPTVVPVLADRADIALPDGCRGHPAFRIHTDARSARVACNAALCSPRARSDFSNEADGVLHLLSHLYAQRSGALWKAPALGTWLAAAVSAALPSLPRAATSTNARFPALFGGGSLLAGAVYRHAAAQEAGFRALLAFVPRADAARTAFAGDPLPPRSALSSYSDPAFFAGADDAALLAPPGTRRADDRALVELVPDPGARAALRRMWDADPAHAARVPGGLAGFVRALAEMGDGALDALMVELVERAGEEGGEEGGMPGGMPGGAAWDVDFGAVPEERAEGVGRDDEEQDDEDEDEDEDGQPAMPVRLVRNVLNRFWGGTGAADASDDEDEEDEEEGGHVH
jgi:hypothetical protein